MSIVFQDSYARDWTSAADMIAPTKDSAEDVDDSLNARPGFDHNGWTAFARCIVAALPKE